MKSKGRMIRFNPESNLQIDAIANGSEMRGSKTNPLVWCQTCCQWIPCHPQVGTVHTCHDVIKCVVETAVPARYWKRRKILYQEIYRIALRKDVYADL